MIIALTFLVVKVFKEAVTGLGFDGRSLTRRPAGLAQRALAHGQPTGWTGLDARPGANAVSINKDGVETGFPAKFEWLDAMGRGWTRLVASGRFRRGGRKLVEQDKIGNFVNWVKVVKGVNSVKAEIGKSGNRETGAMAGGCCAPGRDGPIRRAAGPEVPKCCRWHIHRLQV